MDETSAPYPEGENPFEETEEDKEFERRLIAKYNLVMKEESGQDDNYDKYSKNGHSFFPDGE
jgi:hypothetical protein